MDKHLRDILEALPESPPRSCLDPLRELIEELRRRGRTYREVTRILSNHCEIHVSVSTVHRFLNSRNQTKPKQRKQRVPQVAGLTQLSPKMPTDSGTLEPTADEVQERIAALKLRPAPAQTKSQLFHYDPNEPLHLPQGTGKNKAGE